VPGLRLYKEVDIVGHQAVAEEPKRITLFGPGESPKKREVISIVGEHIRAVVAAINRVIDKAVFYQAT
jgi:hypothetical protein